MYTRKEVIESSLKYFKGDILAANVWADKYCLKDKSGNYFELNPDDMHHRLAKEFARIEQNYSNSFSKEEIYQLFKDFKYLVPAGSPMFGVGNDFSKTSLSNCFVIGSNNDSDSYGSIMRTDEEQVQLMKRRGGVGHDISHLRPSGAQANNSVLKGMAGTTLYMERFSNSTREVSQGDRRGALMLSIDVRHPDVDKFIDIKLQEGKVTGANISVKISNDFMEAVINDSDFYQTFPCKKTFMMSNIPYNELIDCSEWKENDGIKYIKRINARELWNKIVKNAHQSAEPGILFWDQVTKESPADCYADLGYKTVSTNPCFTGDTIVAVADGRNGVSIKELSEKGLDIPVYCSSNLGELDIKTMRNIRKTETNVKIIKITLDNGSEIKCTENHKFYLKNGEIKEAINLDKGDSLHILSKVKEDLPQNRRFILNSNGISEYEHRFIYKKLVGNLNDLDIHHLDENPFNNSLDNLQTITNSDHNKVHNKSYPGEINPNYSNISNEDLVELAIKLTKQKGSRLTRKDWYSNGGIAWSKYRKDNLGELSVFFKEVSLKCFDDKNLTYLEPRVVLDYKEAILNGYKTKIEKGKVYVEKECENCHDKFYVKYSKREQSFCSQSCAVTSLNNKKWKGSNDFNLNSKDELYNHKVESVEFYGYDDVYNGTVDEHHNFFMGGFKGKTSGGKEKLTYCLTANCGEIPLCPYDSCRLLAINLYSYVVNPFTKEAQFDFKLFKEHVNKAQRIMDDLIDLEVEKLDLIIDKIKLDPESVDIKTVELKLWEKIKEKAIQARRTGLGITAEGDMLAALGMRYGSDVAINFSEDVHKQMAIESYKSSIQLAEERGAFPIWDFWKENENPFLKRVLTKVENYGQYTLYGRRNIANLTIAPTGTTSLMTQTTSGIEPLFLPYYERSRKVDGVDKSKIHFTDSKGDHWEKFLVFHPKFIEWFIQWNELGLAYQEGEKTLSLKSERDLQIIFENSPYSKSTANDIDWEKKVEMQGKIQKWIDHSISVTTNLPKSATVEDVNKIYMKAWKVGCKGITVYRDGCRDGVLNAVSAKKTETNEFQYNDSFKRPETVECDIYRKTALKQNWLVLVGKVNGLPYEIFGIKDVEKHSLPFKIEKGIITKVKSKVYKLTTELDGKQYEIKNIVDLMSEDERTDTRKYSLMLRHRVSPKFIREQIEEFASIVSFDKVVYRVLGNYCKDEENTKKEKCPQCGGELRHESGCVQCVNPECGYSKCG